MNCTGSPAAATCDHTRCRCGISATQGPHHWPHTFRTRTLPLASATVHGTPWSVVPLTVKGVERCFGTTRSIVPSPETNPLPSPDLACAAMELASLLQAAAPRQSAPTATAAASLVNIAFWYIYATELMRLPSCSLWAEVRRPAGCR